MNPVVFRLIRSVTNDGAEHDFEIGDFRFDLFQLALLAVGQSVEIGAAIFPFRHEQLQFLALLAAGILERIAAIPQRIESSFELRLLFGGVQFVVRFDNGIHRGLGERRIGGLEHDADKL